MTDAEYRRRELQRVLDAGPYPGEDFHRLCVTGNAADGHGARGASNWLSITPAQLARIVAVLGEEAN